MHLEKAVSRTVEQAPTVWVRADVCLCSHRNAFPGEHLELVVNYTAKRSFCRHAVDLTRKSPFLSLSQQKLK